MNSPSNSIWVTALICCIAPLTIFVLGWIAATAHIKGWIKVKLDTSQAPKFNWRRNRQ